MVTAYCGETDGKRAARGYAYYRSAGALYRASHSHDLRKGRYLTLCGPEAVEADALTCLAEGFHSKDDAFTKVIMADLQPVGLEIAAMQGIDIYHGRVQDLLEKMRVRNEQIAFAHLDFMGHLSSSVELAVRRLGRILMPGGVVLLTFLRGREFAKTPNWDRALTFVKHVERVAPGPSLDSLEDRRMCGYIMLLSAWLGMAKLGPGRRFFQPIFYAKYFSKKSPMGIIGLQQVASSDEIDPMRHHFCSDFDRQVPLRDFVLQPTFSATPAKDLGRLFNVPPGTLAAWRAVRTMRVEAKL